MPTSSSPAHRWLRLLLVLVTLGSACLGQYSLSIQFAKAWAAAGWAAAAVAFLLLYWLGRDGHPLPSAREQDLSRRTEWILLATVLAIGVFFKLYKLSEFPPGLNHDAAWEGQYAISILRGAPYTPYISAAWGRETLTFYFRAVSVWLFGPVPLAVYGPSVIAGILVLPFLYFWARNMFGVRTALLVTWMLGVSGWSLVFSRSGWRSDFQPLFTAITCCFFVRGMRTRSAIDFALAGLGLAATVNVYNAARTFPLLFALWLPIVVLQSWHWRGFWRRYGKGLLAMAITFAVAVAPLAWYAYNNWTKFQGRANFLVGSQPYVANLKKTLLMFHYWANGDDFFTTTPGLEFWAAIFLVFGLLWCLLRIRDERAQFVLLGLALGLLPGYISNPNMNRNIGAMPFVYFLSGLGILFFLRELAQLIPRAGNVLAAGFGIAVSIAAAVATYAQYLGPNHRSVWGFYPETTVVGRYMATVLPKHRVWVGGANFPRDTLIFLSYQGGDPMEAHFTWVEDVTALMRAARIPPGQKGLAFILATDGPGPVVFAELQRRYPSHKMVDLRHPPETGRVFARALLVPPVGEEATTEAEDDTAPPAELPNDAATPPGKLQEPRGVTVLSDGTIVVCDFGNNRLQMFDRQQRFIKLIGHGGEGAAEFKQPGAVAVGPGDEFFVADTWNHRVQVFAKDGTFKRQWLGSFFSPRGIAVDAQGNVLIADSGHNRVARFNVNGDKLGEWDGSANSGRFQEPIGIATGADGRVYVSDVGNGRLQIFTREGKGAGGFKVDGWLSQAYSEPHIAIDPSQRIWVTVPARREIRAYDSKGKLLKTISNSSHQQARFGMPMGIAYDAGSKTLVVTDLGGEIFRVRAEDMGLSGR